MVNLFGRAEKLEKTYRAIISRHVSVSSKWTVFSPSSAWVTAFSSAEPRLQVVVEVCILHQEAETVTAQERGQRRKRKEPPDAFEHKHRHAHSEAHRHAESRRNATHQCSGFWLLCKLICACQSMHINRHTGFITDTAVVNSLRYKETSVHL